MSIISPGHGYHEALDIMNFKECETLFITIVNDNNHHLYKLLPAMHETTYLLKRVQPFSVPGFKTDFK